MKQFIKFLPLILLLLAASCNKEEDPCPTCINGKVTCKINGEKWKAKCNSDVVFGCTPYRCKYYVYGGKSFTLWSSNSDSGSGIYFGVSSASGGINFGLNTLSYLKNTYGVSDSCGWYYTDTTKLHTVEVLSIDSINFIIEGNFEYSAIGECGTQIDITEGYFKVPFSTK